MKSISFPIWCLSILSCWAAPIKVPNTQYYSPEDLSDHPGHLPFISYLTFRNLCDHIIDQNTEWFDPDAVKQGDLVCIKIWYLDWFVKNVHDHIPHPYILVSGDVGNWLPRPEIKKLLYDPKLAAWFCRNIVFSYHPKIFQLPMGQDFALFVSKDTQSTTHLIQAIAEDRTKDQLLYMNFYPRPEGDRDLIVKLFEDQPYCFSRNRSDQPYVSVDRPTYFQDLARSQFALSPVGLETDSVRTWEALALNCIPIIEHTFLDPIYEGLPVAIVDDWERIDPQFLEKKYRELKHLKNEKAYFQYWERLIRKVQNKVKASDLSFTQLEATLFNQRDLEDLKSILMDTTTLIYKGGLTSIRPLQISSSCPFLSSILVYDPWLDTGTFQCFDRYLQDRSYLKWRDKVTVIDIPYVLDGPQTLFNDLLIRTCNPYAVFLDFTYYRHSLLTDFTTEFRIFRHRLKRDLNNLYDQLPLFALLVGNGLQDSHVKSVLEAFAQESHALVEQLGSFWYVRKFPVFGD